MIYRISLQSPIPPPLTNITLTNSSPGLFKVLKFKYKCLMRLCHKNFILLKSILALLFYNRGAAKSICSLWGKKIFLDLFFQEIHHLHSQLR